MSLRMKGYHVISLAVFLNLCFHFGCSRFVKHATTSEDELAGKPIEFSISMPKLRPKEIDSYNCVSVKIPKEGPVEKYIVGFRPRAKASSAHHLLLFGCKEPDVDPKRRSCGNVCMEDNAQVIYAWAKNAPPLELKKGVGFKVGGSSGIQYLVLQVHYARVFTDEETPDETGVDVSLSYERQPYVAGIGLLFAAWANIPSQTRKFSVDLSCHYRDKQEIHPFGYRTHAHKLGRVITGYLFNGTWTQIGKGDPQKPQSFYPVEKDIVIKSDDIVAARCEFDSTSRKTTTVIGPSHTDEMCNFYMMYYTLNTAKASTFWQCEGNSIPGVTSNFPADVDLKPVKNDDSSKTNKNVNSHHGPPPQRDTSSIALEFDKNWPSLPPDVKLGQVAGVACDSADNVYIFHRGSTVWDGKSFTLDNKFTQKDMGPIKQPTIIKFDKSGKIIQRFGENMFYMPHGLNIDNQDNLWLTDVALHQVFKILRNEKKPNLTLGERFIPGGPNDQKRFCKPTDVAVLKSGEFFVSDGYCNSRIMKFKANGEFIKQWGKSSFDYPGNERPSTFEIPHSIVALENKEQVCVADRENGRIQCFTYDGKFVKQYHKSWGGRLFAVTYTRKNGGAFYAVNGPSIYGENQVVAGFTVDFENGALLQRWNSDGQGFQNPHDVCASHDENHVYVVEINPNKVWKFDVKPPIDIEALDVEKKQDIQPAHTSVLDVSKIEQTKLSEKKSQTENLDNADFTSSMVIGSLLVVPIVFIVLITLIIRLRKSGKLRFTKNYKSNKKMNLGHFFGRKHKGFDPVSTEESENELDHLTDSDVEEYSATTPKAKNSTK